MITFDDVKIESNVTYFFLPRILADDMLWCLNKAGITDYKSYSHTQQHDILPSHIDIPTHNNMTLPSYRSKSIWNKPFLIVSHMNTDDLQSKLIQIIECTDNDLIAYHKSKNEHAKQSYQQTHGTLNRQIPIATKE